VQAITFSVGRRRAAPHMGKGITLALPGPGQQAHPGTDASD
jgi:hypothetical protein